MWTLIAARLQLEINMWHIVNHDSSSFHFRRKNTFAVLFIMFYDMSQVKKKG